MRKTLTRGGADNQPVLGVRKGFERDNNFAKSDSLSSSNRQKSPSLSQKLWTELDGVGGEVGGGNWELLRVATSSSDPNPWIHPLRSRPSPSGSRSRASLSQGPPALARRLVRRHVHFFRNWGTPPHFLSDPAMFVPNSLLICTELFNYSVYYVLKALLCVRWKINVVVFRLHYRLPSNSRNAFPCQIMLQFKFELFPMCQRLLWLL